MDQSNNRIIFEGMTSVSALINAARAGNSKRIINAVYFDKSKTGKERRRLSFIKAASAELGFEIRLVESDEIDILATGNTHGGVLADVSEAVYPVFAPENINNEGFVAVIDGVEDPYSLGYSLRALYACGCDAVLLPRHLPNAADSVLCKASAGATELLKIFVGDICEMVTQYKKKGYRVACAAIPDSQVCYESDLSRPLVLIIGGEKRGISSRLMALSDLNVRIPYGREFMGSLSTASAVSVLAYEVLRQNP